MARPIAIPPSGPHRRLDSWREIAAFFGRDERTVRRWEKERGLPVYRVPGSARGGVFAYAEELAEWLNPPNEAREVDELPPKKFSTNARGERESTPGPLHIKVTDVPYAGSVFDSHPHESASTMAAARSWLWLFPLVLIAVSFLLFSLGHREPRFKNALAAPHVADAESQNLYLKGRYYFEKRTPDD